MVEPIFSVEKKCAVCGEKFTATRVRSRLVMIKQDTDFCAHYQDINPYYYTVLVCPHCGYAAQDTGFEEITPAGVERIQKFFAERKVKIDLSSTMTRTREQAIVSYQLAILCGELASLPASRLAALLLRLGWLHREAELFEKEKATLAKAANAFEMALSRERTPIGPMSELTVMYLVGELLRRTGQREKALLYINKVVGSPQAKQERRISDLARDAWQEMRAEARNKQADHEESR